mgnify:CR=1 FL=1
MQRGDLVVEGVAALVETPEILRERLLEEISVDRITRGDAGRICDDFDRIQQATRIARKMVAHWGMSDKVGPVACHGSNEHPFLGRDVYEQREFSERTAQIIDEEVSRVLGEAAERAARRVQEIQALFAEVQQELAERSGHPQP